MMKALKQLLSIVFGAALLLSIASVTAFADSVSVTFDPNTDDPRYQGLTGSYTVEIGATLPSEVKDAAPPTRDTAVFGGWFKDAECANVFDIQNDTVDEELVLYAKWLYLVSYEPNGGSAVEDTNYYAEVVDPLPVSEKEGFVFDGWFYDNGNFQSPVRSGDPLSASITVYAKWLPVCHVTKGAGAVWNTCCSDDLEFETDIPYDAGSVKVSLDGEEFTDINKASNDDGNTCVTLLNGALGSLLDEAPGTHTVSIRNKNGVAEAEFTVTADNKVSFDLQGKVPEQQPAEQTVTDGGKATAPKAPNINPASSDTTNLRFDGWFTDKSCSAGSKFSFDTEIYTDTVLYAKWTPVSRVSFTITPKNNGTVKSKALVWLAEGESYEFSVEPSNKNYIYNVKIDSGTTNHIDGLYSVDDNIYTYKFKNTDVTKAHTVTFSLRSTTTPHTGDSSHIYLWAAVLGVSAVAIVAAVLIYKKHSRK